MSFVNLLPEDYLARRAQKRTNVLCVVLLGLVVAGVLAAAIASEQGYRRTRAVCAHVDEAFAEAGRLIQQMQELEVTRSRMLTKATLTARLLERVPRSYLLATITNALPEGGSLTRFELSGKRPTGLTVITKKSNTQFEQVAKSRASADQPMQIAITLTGLAGTDVEVARFIAAVARCPLVDAVDLVYSQEKSVHEAMAREFQVVLRLKNEADVRDLKAAEAPALAADGLPAGAVPEQAVPTEPAPAPGGRGLFRQALHLFTGRAGEGGEAR